MSIRSTIKGRLMREMKSKVNSQRTRSSSSATPVAARASTSSTPRTIGTRKMFIGKLLEDAQNRISKKNNDDSVGMKKGGAVKPAKKTKAAAPAKKAPAKKAAATKKYNMGGPVTATPVSSGKPRPAAVPAPNSPGSTMTPQRSGKASMPARQVGAIGSAQNNAVTNAKTIVPPSMVNKGPTVPPSIANVVPRPTVPPTAATTNPTARMQATARAAAAARLAAARKGR